MYSIGEGILVADNSGENLLILKVEGLPSYWMISSYICILTLCFSIE